jgi:hypothetical protein
MMNHGYLDWLNHHPDGFVINTGRTPSAAYLMLHRASCGTISGRPTSGTTFMGEYAKVCGERNELEEFARHLGGHAQPCRLCLARRGQSAQANPQGGKYGPLREHLSGNTGTRVHMTFKAMEDLVGRLPDSAYRHRAWWGNNDASVEAKAWLDAGWRVESVDQAAGEVVFTRAADGQQPIAARSAVSRLGYVDPQVSASLAARAEAIGLDPGKLTRLVAELNDNYSRATHTPPMRCCAPSSITFRLCSAVATSRRSQTTTPGAGLITATLVASGLQASGRRCAPPADLEEDRPPGHR